MAKLTIRLTDEQHAALVRDAEANHRSIQGECMHRLFPPQGWTTPHAARVETAEGHFKPDPKKGK